MAKSNYEELDAGGGLEIHNANEALQGKSLVRQLRRMRRPPEQERGNVETCTARGHLKNKTIQNVIAGREKHYLVPRD